MTASGLRDELGVRPDPEFEMELPPGWSRSRPDDATLQSMLSDLKRRLMEAQRPELYAQAKSMLEQSFQDMRRNGVFAFFSATETDPGTLFLPASINASIRTAEAGESLDDMVRTLIREHGATSLLGEKRTVRAERERTVRLGTETIINHTVVYLTPVPGSKRRRALQLTAGFPRTLDAPADDPMIESMRLLFDTCVASLRWRVPRRS